MTAYFSSVANPDGATYATAMHNVDGRRFLKDSLYTVRVDSRHQYRAVQMFRDKGSLERASEPLGKRYALRVDDKPIPPSQRIEKSKIAIVSTVIRRREPALSDTMQSLLNYAKAFGEDYCVRFVDVCITDSVENMWSSTFLVSNYRGTYICFITVGEMMMNRQGGFSFSEISAKTLRRQNVLHHAP